MRPIVFASLFLLTSGVAYSQPQRIERNVARAKSTLSSVIAEPSWKDGDLITTQGYSVVGDGGGNNYIYHRTGWSELASPDGYGFHVRTGVSDAYLEAVDKTKAVALQFGVTGSGDESNKLQACFDAAADNRCDVYLPGFAFRASVTVAENGNLVPSVIGISGKTIWQPPSGADETNWCLKINSQTSANGMSWKVENVIFAEGNFLGRSTNGVQVVGPMRNSNFFKCEFRDFLVGLCTNHAYEFRYESCGFFRNMVGLLNSARQNDNPLDVNGTTINLDNTFSGAVSHPGLQTLENCDFSSNAIGWTHEQPDNNIGIELESVATSCIFQGSGLGIYIAEADVGPSKNGLTLINCHFEHSSSSNTYTFDGSTVTAGDLLLEGGIVEAINTRFAVVRQRGLSRVNHRSPASPFISGLISAVHEYTENTLFTAENVSGFQTLLPGVFSEVVSPSSTESDVAGLNWIGTRCWPRIPSLSSVVPAFVISRSCSPGDMPLGSFGGSVTAVEDSNLPFGYCAEVTSATNGGVTLLGSKASTGGEIVYQSFMVRADSPVTLNIFNAAGGVGGNITTTTDWREYHYIGRLQPDASQARTIIRNAGASTATWQVAQMQYLLFDSIADAVRYQKARTFWCSRQQLALLNNERGHAQISIEDNATATTVASTQSDWSAKSQFVGFGTNFADSINATPDHTNDHITLTSAGVWEVSCVLTCSGSVVSDLWELALWKNNGATQVSTKQGVNIRGAGLTYEKQVTISGLVDASANDTIELWVQRTNGTGTLTITNAVMTATKVSD